MAPLRTLTMTPSERNPLATANTASNPDVGADAVDIDGVDVVDIDGVAGKGGTRRPTMCGA